MQKSEFKKQKKESFLMEARLCLCEGEKLCLIAGKLLQEMVSVGQENEIENLDISIFHFQVSESLISLSP